MAGTFLGKYDTTAANNTATGTGAVSVAEGMLPSNINNAFRGVMADIRQHYNNAEWIEYGDGAGTYTPTYVSSTSFTIDGVNVTTPYHVGRRIKLVASSPGTIYGSITAVSFSTNTTVTVAWDSGSLSNEAITSVHLGVLSKTNSSIPLLVIGSGNIAADAITGAQLADDAIDSEHYTDGSIDLAHMSVNSIDSDQYVDTSIDLAHLSADSVDGSKIVDDAIDSEHYTDGSIDLAHMSVNSIDSDQYVDGSIDTAHIADVNVTLAKLAASSVNSSKIVDDSIVNADINSSAAINFSKMENLTTARALVSDGSGDVSISAVTSTEVGYLDGVTSAIQTQLDAKNATITGSATTIDTESLTASRALISNSSQKVAVSAVTDTELGYLDGVSSAIQTQMDTKAATSYVDNAVVGLRTRIICEAASTANVVISSALEAGDSIDGVTLVAGDQVLLKDQSTASQNGIYTAVGSGAGAASRSTEYDAIDEISGQMVVINQGSANDNTIWLCTTNSSATLGSDSIAFTKITPSNTGTVTSIVTGTGIDGGTITSTGTLSIDSTVATLAGTQTLTNKTLTSPKINEDVEVTSTATELNLLDGVNSTTAELNIVDGGTSATSTTLADADRLVVNDSGVMVQVAISDVKTYLNSAGYVTDDPTALAIALG